MQDYFIEKAPRLYVMQMVDAFGIIWAKLIGRMDRLERFQLVRSNIGCIIEK
jgi:hypothetical protein